MVDYESTIRTGLPGIAVARRHAPRNEPRLPPCPVALAAIKRAVVIHRHTRAAQVIPQQPFWVASQLVGCIDDASPSPIGRTLENQSSHEKIVSCEPKTHASCTLEIPPKRALLHREPRYDKNVTFGRKFGQSIAKRGRSLYIE